MQLAEWKSGGKTFSYRGHKIFYRYEGHGDVVLCVHGFPTSSWDWQPVWQQLTARHRVIAPDMIGFGFSDKPADYHYSLKDQATLHEELMNSLGIGSAHIFAHDYGVSVTQELLARYEERAAGAIEISSICFLNGGLFPETHHARLVQKLLMTPLGSILSRLVNERSFRRSFAEIFGPQTKPSEAEMRDFWSIVSYNQGHKIAHKIIRYIAERRENRERWVGAMQQTRVPLRLINGPADPVSGRHMADRYRVLIPNADIVLLDEIGHYPQVEAPQKTFQAYNYFLSNLPANAKN